MKSSTVCFALSVALLASSNGFCDCDDDDNCVGLFLVDGSFEITQNDVFSGETDAVRVWGPLADLTVSGGSIVGESGTGAREFGSDGIDVDLGGRVIVNGGMISGSDDGIKVKTDSTVTINAGTIFGGGSGLRTTNSSRVTINGGDISGNEFGSRHTRGSDTLIFGGNIDGTTRLEDDSSLSIFGGEMDSISAGGSAIIKIFGGMPTVPISLYERSRVAIFRDSAGNLLDGSTLESSIDQLSFDSRVSNFETTSTDTVILNSVEAFAVLNGDNDTATTVDMRADAFTNEAYVAEDSTLILRSGMGQFGHGRRFWIVCSRRWAFHRSLCTRK